MGDKPFEDRIAFAEKIFGKGGEYASMERIKVLPQEEVRDRQHVLDKLKEIETLGGEGVMLRKPQSYVLFSLFFCISSERIQALREKA
jgi:DNA ligase-1